jgi:hypothetical protein
MDPASELRPEEGFIYVDRVRLLIDMAR